MSCLRQLKQKASSVASDKVKQARERQLSYIFNNFKIFVFHIQIHVDSTK